MSYEAKVFRILIASPSDVHDERDIAVKTIQEWNDLHSAERQIVLLPLRWETHTAPEYGKRPQEVINKQMVDHCDLLMGIFWTRLGSNTGMKESGTLEEIDRVALSGKPIMLYFSNAKKDPNDIDTKQLEELREFKKKTYPIGLVENYSSLIEFRDKFTKQIEMQLRNLLANNSDGFSGKISSNIELEFTDAISGKRAGNSLKVRTNFLNITDFAKIPDYGSNNPSIALSDGSFQGMILGGDRFNTDYYREYVEFAVTKNLFFPINFWLKNNGTLGAKDLYIDIKVESESDELIVLSSSDYNQKKPSKNRYEILGSARTIGFIDVDIHKSEVKPREWEISFDLNALQPKREIYPELLIYIGSRSPCLINFKATIYADSLPEPIICELTIDLDVNVVNVSGLEILNQDGELEREHK
ncbi:MULTISPECIES: hypothetical protein [unclassified Aeromonas]|uniref:hypothetical protein n=1 Tax=unclassified Aeromonas TaxID=257493 RepID=UPI00084AC7F4|nr:MULTISPECIES: hypothetical protein [unclassified Aeromonas]OEC52048.1 hypothetical protein A9G04_17850 [Aeromonas sp. ANNP30]OEC63411.1 hypothetical protein A9G49_16025 [Aeromonas sp. ANP5]